MSQQIMIRSADMHIPEQQHVHIRHLYDPHLFRITLASGGIISKCWPGSHVCLCFPDLCSFRLFDQWQYLHPMRTWPLRPPDAAMVPVALPYRKVIAVSMYCFGGKLHVVGVVPQCSDAVAGLSRLGQV